MYGLANTQVMWPIQLHVHTFGCTCGACLCIVLEGFSVPEPISFPSKERESEIMTMMARTWPSERDQPLDFLYVSKPPISLFYTITQLSPVAEQAPLLVGTLLAIALISPLSPNFPLTSSIPPRIHFSL